ncbi:MAG: MBL fold metallo-hydrolase [Candidatus Nomurabacteria bacterium]|jgi:L-ascorbate metabolism protein UlaG (beta-lactamase superfamily)|nr:MBL fold metallo-hydrolase [Candidatus Nomurabacteria bacterium]
MEIDFRGANSVVVKSKAGTIVTDPTDNVKVNEINNDGVITIVTQDDFIPKKASFVINMPGEYEHNDISIIGMPMQRHIDPDGKVGVAYRLVLDGVRIAVLGHILAPISDDDLEALGVVDVLILPVGGGGYTLDAKDAAAITRQIGPKVVIPTHYEDKDIKYEVPQEPVEAFIKEIGGNYEKVDSLKLKNGALPEVLTVYELKRK